MDTTLSLAEFNIALGTTTLIALGVILTVTKMLIGQVLRNIKESETRHSADIQEIKSIMKQMNSRIDDLAHAMYDINGQLQRIVGYLGLEGIIVKKRRALVDALKCPGVLPHPYPLHNKDHSDR